MRRVILKKEAGLFTVDKYAGIVVSTTISGNTGAKTEKIAFPRMVEADIQSYAAGHGVSIPVEFGLIDGLRLREKDISYSNVDFDFNVIKGKKRNGWGQALNALVDITKKLPIPANPFTEGFTFFADYANSVVDASVQQRKADNLKQGVVHLSFSPNGQCGNKAFESTGTIAIVFASPGTEADGIVDIGRVGNNEYCWAAELQTAFSVKFGRKTNGNCSADTAIRNDYYGFFLNALPVSTASAAALREDVFVSGRVRPSVAPAVAGSVAKEISEGDAELRVKATTAAEWDPTSNTAPFGKVITKKSDSTIVWRASGVESKAFDIAQALRRCAANGVKAEKCLPRASVTTARSE